VPLVPRRKLATAAQSAAAAVAGADAQRGAGGEDETDQQVSQLGAFFLL
jgi:hypothetical protein